MIGVRILVTPISAGALEAGPFSLHEKLASVALWPVRRLFGLPLAVLLKIPVLELHSCKTSITPTAPNRHSTLNPFAMVRTVFILTKNNKFLETTRIFIHKVLLTKTFYPSGKTITLAKIILVSLNVGSRLKSG